MKRKKTRKKPLSLLEVVIALSLTSILLFFLFGYYRQLIMVDLDVEKLQERFSARERVQTRLMQVFSSFPPLEKKDPGFLYTDTTPEGVDLSLIFAYENGLDSDPLLSGRVKGILFVSRDKKLKMRTLSLEEKAGEREEVLMESVQSISFSFLNSAEDKWDSLWAKDAAAFPAVVKLRVCEDNKQEKKKEGDQENNKIDYAFFLPASLLPIEYD